jgi:hypothetical protein
MVDRVAAAAGVLLGWAKCPSAFLIQDLGIDPFPFQERNLRDSPCATGNGLLASLAAPDTDRVSLDCVLSAERACFSTSVFQIHCPMSRASSLTVFGVLGDFHLLDLLSQGGTITVVAIVSRGDNSKIGRAIMYRVPYLPVTPTSIIALEFFLLKHCNVVILTLGSFGHFSGFAMEVIWDCELTWSKSDLELLIFSRGVGAWHCEWLSKKRFCFCLALGPSLRQKGGNLFPSSGGFVGLGHIISQGSLGPSNCLDNLQHVCLLSLYRKFRNALVSLGK